MPGGGIGRSQGYGGKRVTVIRQKESDRQRMNPLNFMYRDMVGFMRDYGTSPKDYGQMLQMKRSKKKRRRQARNE